MAEGPADTLSPRHGILWMLLAALMSALVEAGGKYLVADYSVAQVVWARYAFHAVLLALYLGPRLPRVAATRQPLLQISRSVLILSSTAFYIAGVRFMPLADASALVICAPVLFTALSVPLLKERVGLRRWMGVAAGFVGALIIIRPGFGMAHPAAVLPFAAAITLALYQIATRKAGRTDSTMTSLFHTAATGAILISLVVPFHWKTPDLEGWLLMALLGVLGGAAHFALIKALEVASAGTVSPFRYTSLIWAGVLGFVIFGDLPDSWTLTGAAVITVSGLYIFHREQRSRSTAGPNAPPTT